MRTNKSIDSRPLTLETQERLPNKVMIGTPSSTTENLCPTTAKRSLPKTKFMAIIDGQIYRSMHASDDHPFGTNGEWVLIRRMGNNWQERDREHGGWRMGIVGVDGWTDTDDDAFLYLVNTGLFVPYNGIELT